MVNRYSEMLTGIPPGYRLSFHRSFPSHHPACLETALPFDIEHDLQYNVIPVGQPELIAFEKAVKSAMVPAGSARESVFYLGKHSRIDTSLFRALSR